LELRSESDAALVLGTGADLNPEQRSGQSQIKSPGPISGTGPQHDYSQSTVEARAGLTGDNSQLAAGIRNGRDQCHDVGARPRRFRSELEPDAKARPKTEPADRGNPRQSSGWNLYRHCHAAWSFGFGRRKPVGWVLRTPGLRNWRPDAAAKVA
jgi:hypothetical protein